MDPTTSAVSAASPSRATSNARTTTACPGTAARSGRAAVSGKSSSAPTSGGLDDHTPGRRMSARGGCGGKVSSLNHRDSALGAGFQANAAAETPVFFEYEDIILNTSGTELASLLAGPAMAAFFLVMSSYILRFEDIW